MTEELEHKGPPKNFAYFYRDIMHVESPMNWENEEAFQESVRLKYKKIDSGEYKKQGRPDPMTDLKPEIMKMQQDVAKLVEAKKLEKDKDPEKEALFQLVEDLQAQLAAQGEPEKPKEGPASTPTIEPETKKTIGAGDCPGCGKHYTRLDMHVCKEANQNSKE